MIVDRDSESIFIYLKEVNGGRIHHRLTRL